MAENTCRRRKLPAGGIASVVGRAKGAGGGSASGSGAPSQRTVGGGGGLGMMPSEVDEAFKALLEETLEPDKQEALMAAYKEETDPQQKYNMLLEFSSYLRQSHMRDGDDPYDPNGKQRRTGGGGGGGGRGGGGGFGDFGGDRALKGGQRGRFAGYDDDENDVSLAWEICRVLLLVGAVLGFILGLAWWINQQVEKSTSGANLEPIQPFSDEERDY